MKLLERYATFLGLQIGRQHLVESFYPLPFARYITLHASSGMPGKNYPYYGEVVALIKPYLADIEIVQMGGKDEPPVPGCYHVMGKTSLGQGSHLLRSSLLHLGNDSVWQHRGGYLDIPLVELFGTTSEANHSPYQFNRAKTRFLSSHRWGRNPTFAAQEPQSTIALIDPFDVARAVLDLLEIPHTITQHTLTIGQAYNATVLDWIPNVAVSPQFNPDLPLAARMDLHFDEQILGATLQTGRKVNIVTKQPINLNILAAFKDNILSYNHEVDETTPVDYVRTVRKILKNVTFFSRETDTAKLSRIRFNLFDVAGVQHVPHKTRADFDREAASYLNRPEEEVKKELDLALKSGTMMFKTQKFVLSKGKIYLSLAHEKADLPMDGNVQIAAALDDEMFWRDLNHWMMYREK